MEWRARETAPWKHAARDESARWRLQASTSRHGMRGELRLARVRRITHRESDIPFVSGTRVHDARATVRAILTVPERSTGLLGGLEAGTEERTTNTGTWTGRWTGLWAEGDRLQTRWTAGLAELAPAPGRSLSVSPRWVGGRAYSVSRRTLLAGARCTRRGRHVDADVRVLAPVSPAGPPRIELALVWEAERTWDVDAPEGESGAGTVGEGPPAVDE
jgi:hypothetical protein